MLQRLRHALGGTVVPESLDAGNGTGESLLQRVLRRNDPVSPLLYERLALLEKTVSEAGGIEALRAQIAELKQENTELRALIRHEAQRVDYVLGEIEGLAPLREEFHAARKTAEYQLAFTEAEPLVTVVVITHNRSELLVERCIASLQAQTYKNLQIVIVGDYCTDDTAERVAAVGDSRIEFYNLDRPSIYPPPGRDRWCVAGTIPGNHARDKICGRFITHLDEDDTYEPERIALAVETAQRNRADLVWHKFWFQQPDGSWKMWGNGLMEYAQVGLGMTLYHSFFKRLHADVYAYRVGEPGDWNFIRRIKHLRPRMHFIDQPLTSYYRLPERTPFVPRPDETYLD